MEAHSIPDLQLIQDLAVVTLTAGATGWICQKIGLSVVVGYLVAGILIGPFTPPFTLVYDSDRIQLLAKLGLIFLMFFVGMGLSIQRLRRMGVAMAASVFIGAILMFVVCRLAGDVLHWKPEASLYLAGMLMVSSSSIIVKVLEETHATHQRSGQLAVGVSVLEDVVAVVMLTMLGSLAKFDEESTPMANVLGILTAFVVLAMIFGLLIVPRFLARVSRSAAPEIRTLFMIGMVLALAMLALKAGYSEALGAFLLGTIVSETPQKPHIERAFEGLRDMFCAIFFVAIGMMIDVALVVKYLPLIIGFTIFTIVARCIAVSLGLLASGHDTREALRTGLCVTTIGEFSYVIAQMGVQENVVPEFFYPLAVGISLGTTLAAPLLIRNSAKVANSIIRLEPKWLRTSLDQYSRMLESVSRFSEASALWRLTRKRLIHVGIEVAVISGLLIFSEAGFLSLVPKFVEWGVTPRSSRAIFFIVMGLLILPPLVAIWRNISALSLVCAELATSRVGGSFSTQMFFQHTLRGVAAVSIGLWLWSLLPHVSYLAPLILLVAAFLAIVTRFLWRRFVRWHSHLEVRLQESLETTNQTAPAGAHIAAPAEDWDLSIVDLILPENAKHADCTIGELGIRKRFGCTIVGIERQGYPIDYPGPDVRLYPQDKLLLLGTPEKIENASAFLSQSSEGTTGDSLSEWSLETVDVPEESLRIGSTLEDLSMRNQTGVLIAGIHRAGARILSPGGKEVLTKGDQLLVLGTREQLEQLSRWLEMSGA